jgi:hypothetical protein
MNSTSRTCPRPDCGMLHNTTDSYHQRIYHQPTVKVGRPDSNITAVNRDPESKSFICPLCSTYATNDPEGIRVRSFIFCRCPNA